MFTKIRCLSACMRKSASAQLLVNLVKDSLYSNGQMLRYISATQKTRSNRDETADEKPAMKLDNCEVEIIDVNGEEMMENDFWPPNKSMVAAPSENSATAPVDIDMWADEEEKTEGTTEYEKIEKDKTNTLLYPPGNEPPEDRQGFYEFEGIKIWLPKKIFSPGTYRYRLNTTEKDLLADDMRICKFKKVTENGLNN